MKMENDAGAIRDLLAGEPKQWTARLGIRVTEIAPGQP
jgi:hypothetical protein